MTETSDLHVFHVDIKKVQAIKDLCVFVVGLFFFHLEHQGIFLVFFAVVVGLDSFGAGFLVFGWGFLLFCFKKILFEIFLSS